MGEDEGVVNLVVELLDGTLERTVTVLFETSPGGATESGMHVQTCVRMTSLQHEVGQKQYLWQIH